MSLLGDWRVTRERRRRAAVYLRGITQDVEANAVVWLTELPGVESAASARRELHFAQRALGLIVAERDALDDRTASDVAHQLASVVAQEGRRDANLARAWSERWRAYTSALAARGSSEAPSARMARVLLNGAGIANPTGDQLHRATQFILALRSSTNDALRTAFGVASLPDDIRPSAIHTASH